MSAPSIAILGPRHDDEVLALSRALRARGAAVHVVDLTGLPGAHRLSLRGGEPLYDGRPLRCHDAFYLRRLRYALDEEPLLAAAGADPGEWAGELDRFLALRHGEREVAALVDSALALLDVPLVNGLEAQAVHPRKAQHLRRLAAAGLPVPPLLAGNDAGALTAFVEAQGEAGAVLKPLRGLLKTRRFDPGALPELTRRPVLLQRCVAGVTVRAYAVAGEVVAAAALSNRGHVDSSVDPLPPAPTELSEEEREVARRAARAVDLPFTGLDLLRPAGGGPSWLLECNAAPMFANFSRRTGADVAGPLADYLIRRARGGEAWRRGP